nr:hypothetical protein [Desulfobacula sp.]
MGNNKAGWITVDKGVRYKEHPTRKHGIRPDKYFSLRYQVNGESCESGLGWSSEGWKKEKAVAKRLELIENAKAGDGVKTLKQTRKKTGRRKAGDGEPKQDR